MWLAALIASPSILLLMLSIVIAINKCDCQVKRRLNFFNLSFAGVIIAAIVMFFPVHYTLEEATAFGVLRATLLSIFNSVQIFTAGCEFSIIREGIVNCPESISMIYQIWAAILLVIAPMYTCVFVLTLFRNLSAHVGYYCSFFKDVYIFSELNEKSLALASDIKSKNNDAAIVFTDVFEKNEENSFELIQEAKKIKAICFRKDVLVIDFKRHCAKKLISFFAIGNNETENLNQALKLIEQYKTRENTDLYVFSTNLQSEILLSSVDRGVIKIRKINEVRYLINHILYNDGYDLIFKTARDNNEGIKDISAVVVGMGRHGTEMVKALSWFGQMDGYKLEITAFDKDPLAEEHFTALVPELMSAERNGVFVEGEVYAKITIHSAIDVDTFFFAREITKLNNATYVFVALGDDDINIRTAVNLRMYFERMNIHPKIQAVVYNSQQKRALQGVKNFKGQNYDIDFIGDVESIYAKSVFIKSDLEADALARHKKWGSEEDFWNYEYNYRSSVASAIHMKARIACGIPGAGKAEADLTDEEKNILATLEHKRWNAHMRSEGYVFSGSEDACSRNDLAKMHHNLVPFSHLSKKLKDVDVSVASK